MARAYLDWNATAPLRPEARDAMIAAMDVVGNPSSVHAEGRAAKAIVERARGQVAEALGADASQLVFVASATEAAALVRGLVRPQIDFRDEPRKFIVSAVEHDAVYAHKGDAPEIRVDGSGICDLASSAAAETDLFACTQGDHVFAMQAANSETGVLQDVLENIGILRSFGGGQSFLLCDATQIFGKMPWSFAWSEADLAMASAHKVGGPKGVGVLALRSGVDVVAQIAGGGQEMGRRSGTENVIGIAGFGAAVEAAARDLADGVWERVAQLRNILEISLDAAEKDIIFVGKDAARLPNTSCFAVPGWKGETQVMQMDLAGFAVSAGSACSSGKVKPSRVLRAMGYDEVTAASAIRVSLGPTTTEDEVLRFADAWIAAYRRHKARAA
ncbi:cysteine desulfurase family protein [Actibacterium sp. 188UL27-1]|uniref:cysteine desulfurase family protein n=1 Tax=Actibacterium sp. 188UL27-1 TaxID=2786961 RepID=UPI00195EA1B1|nr:cysteine desulfurase family protein [Actibacterium sp. 188UL27-1]MBM7067526.1 cysteine desulfurase [Actibacterium sp. 188UL27-1]